MNCSELQKWRKPLEIKGKAAISGGFPQPIEGDSVDESSGDGDGGGDAHGGEGHGQRGFDRAKAAWCRHCGTAPRPPRASLPPPTDGGDRGVPPIVFVAPQRDFGLVS